jgi:metal-dependent amidase/aminoacylase/carboxypeptidase family protein
VVGAALALADHRDQLAGRVVVMGCPADEIHAHGTLSRGGGKALSVEAGLWEDIDVALYSHPEFIDTVSLASRWMRREHVHLDGGRDLGGQPEPPLMAAQRLIAANALDIMLEHLELDGDVEDATSLALSADMLVFADDEGELESRCAAVRAAVPEGSWSSGITYRGVRPDDAITARVRESFAAAGRGFEARPPKLPFATDVGNISQAVPAALIGVGREGGWAFHTDEGREQFLSEDGAQAALTTARVLALSAARLTEPV